MNIMVYKTYNYSHCIANYSLKLYYSESSDNEYKWIYFSPGVIISVSLIVNCECITIDSIWSHKVCRLIDN